MSEEQRARALLTAAAELPGLGPAPVERMIATGRRRRARARVYAAACAAMAVTIAVTVSAAVRPSSPASRPGVPFPDSAEALAHGHWTQLPRSPLGGQLGGAWAEWTGHELLVFRNSDGVHPVRGAAYVPGAGWHVVAPIPDGLGMDSRGGFAGTIPDGLRTNSSDTSEPMAFAGTDLVVENLVPGHRGHALVLAIYIPATNTWSVSSPLLAPDSAAGYGVAGEMRDQVVLAQARSSRLHTYRYSMTTHRWRQSTYSLLPASTKAYVETASAAGQLAVWWRWSNPASHVSVYTISADGAWRAVTGWPPNLSQFMVKPADGHQILLTKDVQHAAAGSAPAYEAEAAYLVDPVSLTVRELPVPRQAPHGLRGWAFQPVVWTGAALIAFAPYWPNGIINPGPVQEFSYYIDALDPTSGRWYRLPFGPRDVGDASPPVWRDHRMFVTNGNELWSFGS